MSTETRKVVALDYDNTFTLNHEFWWSFIDRAYSYGFDTVIVTYRDMSYDLTEQLKELMEGGVPVYFTKGVAKKWWMEQFARPEHSKPSIWIDDKPETLFNNSNLDREGLTEWRKSTSLAASATR